MEIKGLSFEYTVASTTAHSGTSFDLLPYKPVSPRAVTVPNLVDTGYMSNGVIMHSVHASRNCLGLLEAHPLGVGRCGGPCRNLSSPSLFAVQNFILSPTLCAYVGIHKKFRYAGDPAPYLNPSIAFSVIVCSNK